MRLDLQRRRRIEIFDPRLNLVGSQSCMDSSSVRYRVVMELFVGDLVSMTQFTLVSDQEQEQTKAQCLCRRELILLNANVYYHAGSGR
jgi:hypothetical protein